MSIKKSAHPIYLGLALAAILVLPSLVYGHSLGQAANPSGYGYGCAAFGTTAGQAGFGQIQGVTVQQNELCSPAFCVSILQSQEIVSQLNNLLALHVWDGTRTCAAPLPNGCTFNWYGTTVGSK
jgi:hypothetical protein